jgi:hypothetical protein
MPHSRHPVSPEHLAANRMARQSNSWSLFLRYKAQAKCHYRRAVGEFERPTALRKELPNKAILEAQPERGELPNKPNLETQPEREDLPNKPNFETQPEQNKTTYTPFETNPFPPENPAITPGPPAPVSELKLGLAGASGLLEGLRVEGRHPGSAPPGPRPPAPDPWPPAPALHYLYLCSV